MTTGVNTSHFLHFDIPSNTSEGAFAVQLRQIAPRFLNVDGVRLTGDVSQLMINIALDIFPNAVELRLSSSTLTHLDLSGRIQLVTLNLQENPLLKTVNVAYCARMLLMGFGTAAKTIESLDQTGTSMEIIDLSCLTALRSFTAMNSQSLKMLCFDCKNYFNPHILPFEVSGFNPQVFSLNLSGTHLLEYYINHLPFEIDYKHSEPEQQILYEARYFHRVWSEMAQETAYKAILKASKQEETKGCCALQ